jgi:hypothetical protein
MGASLFFGMSRFELLRDAEMSSLQYFGAKTFAESPEVVDFEMSSLPYFGGKIFAESPEVVDFEKAAWNFELLFVSDCSLKTVFEDFEVSNFDLSNFEVSHFEVSHFEVSLPGKFRSAENQKCFTDKKTLPLG